MNVLFICNGMHNKNLNAILKYGFNITQIYDTNVDSYDLSKYDIVYSPGNVIDVSKYPNTKFLFGPHFSVFPEKHHMDMIRSSNSIYIQPSEWAANVWLNNPLCNGIRTSPLPFGVDTDTFKPEKPIYDRNLVFIYFKRRQPQELNLVINFLHSKNIEFRMFDYVNRYSEQEYLEYLHNSKFGIWLDAHESQGFALEEALSCDVPLFVWNVKFMGQEYGSNYGDIPATTIPYWDERCGEVFYDSNDLSKTFDKFISNIHSYKPREYIEENLSISKCARKFIEVVNKI